MSWYSWPMAESMSSRTKYFRPLLPPSATRHSHVSSKRSNCAVVMMSRCPRVSFPVPGSTVSRPLLDSPARVGGVGLLVAAPSVERCPVEEQCPAGLLFLSGELIDRASGRGFLGDGRRRERGRRRNRRDRRRDVVTQVRHGFHPLSMLAGPHSHALGPTQAAARARAPGGSRLRSLGADQAYQLWIVPSSSRATGR